MAVVEEFVAVHSRLPAPDVESEEFARVYAESALGRRHVSTESGEQLTGQQAERWCALFSSHEDGHGLAWAADPVFAMATEYYGEHGHLEVTKPAKERDPIRTKLCCTASKSYGKPDIGMFAIHLVSSSAGS